MTVKTLSPERSPSWILNGSPFCELFQVAPEPPAPPAAPEEATQLAEAPEAAVRHQAVWALGKDGGRTGGGRVIQSEVYKLKIQVAASCVFGCLKKSHRCSVSLSRIHQMCEKVCGEGGLAPRATISRIGRLANLKVIS